MNIPNIRHRWHSGCTLEAVNSVSVDIELVVVGRRQILHSLRRDCSTDIEDGTLHIGGQGMPDLAQFQKLHASTAGKSTTLRLDWTRTLSSPISLTLKAYADNTADSRDLWKTTKPERHQS
jgi:hypothetical protein